SRTPIRLRYLIPIPGICNNDMLSFNGSCYAVSAFKQNLTEALSTIEGDVELASFASMAEINEFVAANIARESEYPYRRPLNLSQPLRLGMFLGSDGQDQTVSMLKRGNNSAGCGLEPLSTLETFKISNTVVGPCAHLSLDVTDKALVEFGSCDASILALIKFPQVARSDKRIISRFCPEIIPKVLSMEKDAYPLQAGGMLRNQTKQYPEENCA
uniref:MHD domain-containing protein n=1 Tax=Macrostomum lignano TaxID=282301 RepID=A0A1I8FVN4_9PLAT